MPELYCSRTDIISTEGFALSFDVDGFTTIGFGISENKESKLDNIDKFLYIDNGLNLIDKSKDYVSDGNYIVKKAADNDFFFGTNLKIYEGKVYEEVKDSGQYKDGDDILVKDSKLYKHTPGRFIYENDTVKLVKDSANLTTIFTIENGITKNETYLFNDELLDFHKKIRFVMSNGTRSFTVSKLTDKLYEKIITGLFKNPLHNCYVYLYTDKADISNLLINYSSESVV